MDSENKIVSLKGKKLNKHKSSDENLTEFEDDIFYCSFCKRPNTQVPKMVKGPGVCICSECTIIAVQYLILENRLPSSEAQKILDLFWSKS